MNNPATWGGALTFALIAVMGVLSAFGHTLTDAQRTSLLMLMSALIAVGTLVVHFLTTSKKTAQHKIDTAWQTDPTSDPTVTKPTA